MRNFSLNETFRNVDHWLISNEVKFVEIGFE